jgi:hypothetical protein
VGVVLRDTLAGRNVRRQGAVRCWEPVSKCAGGATCTTGSTRAHQSFKCWRFETVAILSMEKVELVVLVIRWATLGGVNECWCCRQTIA